MSQEKKYSAKEAALAVLKTCHDVLVKSEAEKQPGKLLADKEKDQTPKDGVQGNSPDAEPTAGNEPTLGDKVNQVVSEHLAQHGESSEQQELEQEDGLKGHLKLAKFMGRMEHKRGDGKKSEAQPVEGGELKKSDPSKTWKGSKRVHGEREHHDAPTGPTNYRNRNKSSDMDHGQKKGPQGYGKYQEQAQNQKGIHTPVSGVTAFPGGKGTSRAGSDVKAKYGNKPLFSGKDHPAIEEHKKVLSEMKAQPKPNLTKSKNDFEAKQKRTSDAKNNLKGVHKPSREDGVSFPAGRFTRTPGMSSSTPKHAHKQVLSEMKAMPKPNLTKGDNDGKHQDNHSYNPDDRYAMKGVHHPEPMHHNGKGVKYGQSHAGILSAGAARDKNKPKLKGYSEQKNSAAKKLHGEKLAELKAMPKPNLTKEEKK